MTIFLITLGFFLVIVMAMAVGYIFQQKTLAGSCGGLSSMGIEKACDCDNPCEKRQERERKAALKQENSIDIKNI
ncbi:(Na+)-NQR maturation NqrM [Thalassomonas actiniarum]|uniref:(Na+)-NQR maturation NqrM n=1 Tax=Thalassomonas actiniarum TaxID=485447 RepID=A0AAE9YNJ3_9GAMM|nr:(Na+)-NQR maturation NqrM [Thalassomonas actiniarum]WDD98130.1 (Na+)-NQR maturation NqrM [Thalassomonas actiniarum]